jgi:hypothetical protein
MGAPFLVRIQVSSKERVMLIPDVPKILGSTISFNDYVDFGGHEQHYNGRFSAD